MDDPMREQAAVLARRSVPDDGHQGGDKLAAVEGYEVGAPRLLDERGDLVLIAAGEVRGNIHISRLGAGPLWRETSRPARAGPG